MPAVSVITPAYNAEPFLGETIDSVRAQSFTDWELLVVDDGSTDGTAGVVEARAALDPRVRLLRQTNAGPSAARNHAMREARGAFFAFLDSDDCYDAEYLAGQLAVMRRFPETGVVSGTARYVGGPLAGRATRPPRPPVPEFPVLSAEEIVGSDTAVFIMSLFRRSVFDTIGGLDEAQSASEDYDFWIRAALAGFVVRCNPRPLGRYRQRPGSLSHDTSRMLRGMLYTYAKTRPRCPEGSALRATLEARVRQVEEELLLEEAKAALEAGDCKSAAPRLRRLHQRRGGALVGVTAWLAEHAPRAAVLAYRLRHLRLLASRRHGPPTVAAGAAAS